MSRSQTLFALLALALCCLARPGAAHAPAWKRCLEPKKVGPGRAAIRRFYFEATSATCEEIRWGGLKPNGNNFKSLEACNRTCSKVPICELPAAAGSGDVACMAYMPRWAWNSKTGKCEQFVWGGCGGNKNKFETPEACQEACAPVNPCAQPITPGPCEAYIKVWGWNETSGTCQEFVYGGCQGNKNQFQTKRDCTLRCGPVPKFCGLQPKTGPCRARMPRFYFDAEAKTCKQFFYGGCKGNRNNFVKKEACLRTCTRED